MSSHPKQEVINLDYLCMKHAQEICCRIEEKGLKKASFENNVRRSLGILSEDGVYAMFLWLENKQRELRELILPLLNEKGIKMYLLKGDSKFDADFDVFCRNLAEIASDMEKLFFLKKILERTLTYLLYHLKAGEENE